jgi:hypothetical protein
MRYAMPGQGAAPKHGDRLVKRLFLVAAAVVLFGPSLAGAREQRPVFGALLQAQGGQHAKKGPGQPLRGERDKRGEHEKGHKGRLTEEERRELNRDLDRANREIYRK